MCTAVKRSEKSASHICSYVSHRCSAERTPTLSVTGILWMCRTSFTCNVSVEDLVQSFSPTPARFIHNMELGCGTNRASNSYQITGQKTSSNGCQQTLSADNYKLLLRSGSLCFSPCLKYSTHQNNPYTRPPQVKGPRQNSQRSPGTVNNIPIQNRSNRVARYSVSCCSFVLLLLMSRNKMWLLCLIASL